MDHINKHLSRAGRQSTTATQAGQTTQNFKNISSGTAEVVNKIFVQLQAIYPAWRQAYSSDQEAGETKKQWIKGLIEAGMSDLSLIDAAIQTCRGSGKPFIPTVGEFIGYCRKAAQDRLGAFGVMEAYKKLLAYYTLPIQHREPSNLDKFIYHTIYQKDFDVYRFKGMDSEPALEHFSKHYRRTIDHVLNGGDIVEASPPSHRISGPASDPEENKKRGRQALADLKEIMKG